MRKAIKLIVLIATMLLLGCQNVNNPSGLPKESNSDTEYDSNEQVTSNLNFNDKTVTPPQYESMEARSLEEFNVMREMSTCADEEQLQQYIQSIVGNGIQSKDNLLNFVETIDSLPQIPILNGDVTWICFSRGVSIDTGKETSVAFVSTEAESGEWTRVEYAFSITDVSAKISDEKALCGEASVLDSPIKNSNGNLTLYIETRSPHPSGNGTMIQWVAEVDGIFTRIYYYTNNADDVKTESLFSNIKTDCWKER